MPIATPEVYADMLDRAKAGQFAYPAINVSSSQTLNAALKGFADAGSDGIIQVSTGGAEYLSGSLKSMVAGSLAFAAYAEQVAKDYPVHIALHTDHCPKDKLDGFVRPLLAASTERVEQGGLPWFQSHMWDGSAVPLEENLEIAHELLEKCVAAKVVLEIEVGVVGGEEDGVVGEINDKLYSTPEDAIATAKALGTGEHGYFMTALTFGNVHGVYKPGNVKLRPEVLKAAQDAVHREFSTSDDKPFHLVFHGGSGSAPEEIAEAVSYGVVKMNVDTDTQYAFTRPIAGWMLANYDGVLKVDGEVGDKKKYDPRAWGKAAEAGMSARVVEACEHLPVRRDARVSGLDGGLLGIPETRLPVDPAAERLTAGEDPSAVAADHPTSSLAWATLAEQALAAGHTVEGYAYARTGYHRGLDALRRAGWRGQGPVPWSHEPNRGFLRALAALGRAARAIGEHEEEARIATFLRDSSREAAEALDT